MKSTKKMLYSTLLIGGAILTIAQTTHAATTYPDALTANANGTIKFDAETDDVVPSPIDPDKPVKPDEGTNEIPGDLKLVYASSFDFGTHKKSVYGLEAFSTGVGVKEDGATDSTQVIPFVTTKDMRVDRGTGWTLSARASKFTDGTHVVDGAQISLLNANYAGTDDSLKPVPASDNIILVPESTVKVASATVDIDSNKNQGLGLYSLALGTKLDETTGLTDGVKFTLPVNTAVNTSTYTSNIVWTLAAGIE